MALAGRGRRPRFSSAGASLRPGWSSRRCALEVADRCLRVGRRREERGHRVGTSCAKAGLSLRPRRRCAGPGNVAKPSRVKGYQALPSFDENKAMRSFFR